MEEKNIIDMIAEAEQEALASVEEAQRKAADIVTEAEKKALEITKSTEETGAKRTAEILQRAKEEAEVSYQKTIEQCKADAKAYADGILEHIETQVEEIVGRIAR